MAINLNTIAMSSTIFLWLGLIISVISLALFFAISSGISGGGPENLHLHDTYYILIGRRQMLIFLLPFVAGMILVISGLLIRHRISGLRTSFETIYNGIGSENYIEEDHRNP